ncbi:hypothetical protein V1514DRAFT_317842 [Lipomyces japonicus]|uniref:uncharacterized protein n=1 Tax=Lipomyces japonicus TaxID=56871 RepID=UPI0034CF1A80
MTDNSFQIYKATYSGVPVYEFICRNVAVMRRRSDAWMNATQILKVANFDKPQRTRILEREVQKGIHEKIQGGYGKYQGTWVPLERGREIAIQYRVEDVLRPVFEFRPSSTSPPPAPKHITASSVRGRIPRGGLSRSASVSSTTATQSKRAAAAAAAATAAAAGRVASYGSRGRGRTVGRGRGRGRGGAGVVRQVSEDEEEEANEVDEEVEEEEEEEEDDDDDDDEDPDDEAMDDDVDHVDVLGSEDGLGADDVVSRRQYLRQVLTDGESISADSASLTSRGSSASENDSDDSQVNGSPRRKRRAQEAIGQQRHDHHFQRNGHGGLPAVQSAYSSRLLEYYLSPNDDNIPEFLIHPPVDFNVNAAIDDDGHNAFHWACALGNLKMIDVLLRAGANIAATNNLGQTPLIRAITFTNNYELRTFPKIVDILQSTIFHVDRFGQTVFHHIATTTTSKSKLSAARYYVEIITAKITESQTSETLMQFLNHQDNNGDTALHIAARNGARKCVKVFLGYHASTQIINKQGHTAHQYLYNNNNNGNGAGALKSSSSPFQPYHEPGSHRTTPYGGISRRLQQNGHSHNHSHSHSHSHHHHQSPPPQQQLQSQAQVQQSQEHYNHYHNNHNNTTSPYNHSIPLISGQTQIAARPHTSEAAIRATQKVTPAMADHLEALAMAYDAELKDKEADLSQATQLLENMKREILACEAVVQKLEKEAGGPADAKRIADETTAAESRMITRAQELRRIVERKQKQDLLNLVGEEEAVLLNSGHGNSIDNNDKHEEFNSQGSHYGSSKLDYVPGAGDGSPELAQDLVLELHNLQVERRKLVDTIIELWAAAGVGEKMNDYRRLISLSCAVKVEEIDDMLDGIAQALAGDGTE